MRAVLIIIFFFFVPEFAQSQTESDQQAQPLTVYFVVDVSGSMKHRLAYAERELANHFAKIIERDPETSFSRTEFRAKTDEDCNLPVQISKPRPARLWPAPTTERSFARNDYTPLGSALLAAIEHAGEGPAEIYLASDWAQTHQCGISVSEAMQFLNPEFDVSITPVVVRPNDHDLALAQSVQTSNVVVISQFDEEGGKKDRGVEGGETVGFRFWQLLFLFLESWTWLFGFVCLAGSAIWFGLRDSSWSVEIEGRTSEARSLRQLIRDGDTKAQGELTDLIEEKKLIDHKFRRALLLWRDGNRQKRSEQDGPDVDKKPGSIWSKPLFWISCFGATLLVLLALLDERISLGEYDLSSAKAYAQSVLDSDFATAFAGTWLILLYFSSTQGQRRREADRNFKIVTDEAKRLAELERTEAQKEAFTQYSEIYTEVSKYEFPMPWDRTSGTEQDETNYAVIMRHAVNLTLGAELQATTNEDQLREGITRLRALPQPPKGFEIWSQKSRFARFVEVALKNGSISSNVEYWKPLADEFSINSPSKKIEAMQEFLTAVPLVPQSQED